MSVSGKTILITGGASGIGAASAELFAKEGARVIIADVAEDMGRALVSRLGSAHRFVALDVSRKEEWERCINDAVSDAQLDIVLLNAGVMMRPLGAPIYNDPVAWMTPAAIDRIVGINIYGVLWGILTCLPFVEKTKGTILITSSGAGLRPLPFDPAYAMTKHALLGLGISLSPALQERGVRLLTVCPHNIDTPMQPLDMQARKKQDGASAIPLSALSMAEANLYIYEHAAAGEVWQNNIAGPPSRVPDRPS